MADIYALITNGVVSNLIEVEKGAIWPVGVNVTALKPRPAIGWLYDGTTFTAPPPGPVIAPAYQPTRAEVLARMTAAELHRWARAYYRGTVTDKMPATDEAGFHSWAKWQVVAAGEPLKSAYLSELATAWIALGMTQARAQEILTPL